MVDTDTPGNDLELDSNILCRDRFQRVSGTF
jgi:hypothetical protein